MIKYIFEESFEFFNKVKMNKFLTSFIQSFAKEVGKIHITICSDKGLLKINKEFLKHNYYTDIITFDYSSDELVEAELFISKDRIIENAKEYNVSIEIEFVRVIAHGVLHIFGFKDSSKKEKKTMREEENKAIEVYKRTQTKNSSTWNI